MQTSLHLTGIAPFVKRGEHAFSGALLSVDQAREIVSMSHRRPWEGDSTIVHITAAHVVRDDVWNTLLKILEEPPALCTISPIRSLH